MNLSNFKKLFIDGTELKQLFINGVSVWKGGYTNQVPLSIGTDGKIYNGIGYKDGCRVRSGGAETSANFASITGYIPAKPGDVVRLSGWNALNAYAGASNAINVFGADFTNLGQAANNGSYGIFESGYADYRWNSVTENPTGVFNWIVPPDSRIAYIRVTGLTDNVGSKMIVTVNEEITD